MKELHVRYRRLLFAYPREYRRLRGTEIAATFTEMAAEGQRWPRVRDAVSLMRHGLRARLGRPRSRLVVPVTVLAMLIGGLCAAAGGARLGWGGSTGLTRRQMTEAGRLDPSLIPRMTATVDGRASAPGWSIDYLSTPVWRTPAIYFVVDTAITATGDQTTVRPGPTARELVADEQARLTGTGWRITEETVTDTDATLTLRNGDLVAYLTSSATDVGPVDAVVHIGADRGTGAGGVAEFPSGTYTVLGDGGAVRFSSGTEATPTGFFATVYRRTPATVPIFAVLAGLLGAAMTYLLIGWLNRRTGGRRPAHRWVALAGLAVTAVSATPAAVVYVVGLWTALRDHSDLAIRYWGGLVTGNVRTAALVAAIVLVLTIVDVALARPARPATQADPAARA